MMAGSADWLALAVLVFLLGVWIPAPLMDLLNEGTALLEVHP